ncbi:hypothetical protein E9993_07690 [Labilibacter sediminis]|nr:hypothetical protein E9993_07690 [Labilibacter sediminis]
MRDVMLIVHLLSIAMFVGAGFSAFVLNKAAKKLDSATIDGYNKISLTLNYLSKTGLTLLILSGGYLMTPYWAILGQMPLLLTKLILVVVVIILLVLLAIYAKKAKQTNDKKYFAKVNNLQFLNLLAGIVIIVLAVLVFH